MKIKTYVFLTFIITFLIACNLTQSGTTIKGNIANANDLKAFFDVKSLDNAIQSLESVDIKNGNFSLNFPESLAPGIYRVRVGAKSVDLILQGNEKLIEITADLQTMHNFEYTIKGSALSTEYQQTLKGLVNKSLDINKVYAELLDTYDPLLGLATVLGTSPANPGLADAYNKISEKMKANYPQAPITSEFANFASKMNRQKTAESSRYKVQVGQMAPEISLPDVNGKIRKLSDLKGQVVLLDFWASWCGPCRRSNPMVVETYRKFKDQGFTVFNVSLDGLDERTKMRYPADQLSSQLKKEKTKWLNAIEKDQLEWDHHVSDLKKWDSDGAATYGVRSIPTTFLIDKEGKIAALNPNKNTLAQEISKLL